MNHDALGIGIIGYGGFGQFLHRSWSTMDEVVVRAITDSNPDVRAAVEANVARFEGRNADPSTGIRRGAAKPVVTYHADWRSLLMDPSIDVVSIVTPPFAHADMACEAMRAGKHVLIEKPLATTSEDAQRIRAAADETGRVAAVDYMLRFNPIVEALQQWARDGSFGALRRVVVENYAQDESLPREHWFWDPVRSGGILVEHAVHFIDLVNGCTDADIAWVDGLAVRRNDNRIDRMGLTAMYTSGLVTQQFHAFNRPGFFEETGMRFVFDLAQVELEGWIPLCGTINALVNVETSATLKHLPGIEITIRKPIAEVDDGSRPEGWGASGKPAAIADVLYSGGAAYHVAEHVRGRFTLPMSKSEAYATALRALMTDVAAAVRDPEHVLRAGLPEAIRSLEIALAATMRAAERLGT